MQMAWDIDSVKADSIPQFLGNLASQYFDEQLAFDTAAVWHEYDRLVRIRKHEHIDPDSFSLLHYNEADDIVTRWLALQSSVDTLYDNASDEQKPSFWQLVVHPVKASTIFTRLRITQGRNKLYANQRRNTANKLLRETLDLFDADFQLSQEFHSLLDGKWNHMLCQPHMGYGDTWHAPSRDAIFGLAYVQRNQDSNLIVGQMGVAVEGHEGIRAGRINEESERTHPSRRDLVPGLTLGPMSRYGPNKRWFDVFTRGAQIIHWTTSVPYSWIHLSAAEGTLHPDSDDKRIWITVDWEDVPVDLDEEVLITVASKEGDFEHIHLRLKGHTVPSSFDGFVEADGCVSIPASGIDIKSPYQRHPELGRGIEGAVTLANNDPIDWNIQPSLEYCFHTFSHSAPSSITFCFNMTLDIDPADKMYYGFSIDGTPGERHRLLLRGEGKTNLPAEGWSEAVMDCVWKRRHYITILEPGSHVLRVRLNHSNLLLEKIVLDLGGIQESYLGPPPSFVHRRELDA
jgi:hypothetical protein